MTDLKSRVMKAAELIRNTGPKDDWRVLLTYPNPDHFYPLIEALVTSLEEAKEIINNANVFASNIDGRDARQLEKRIEEIRDAIDAHMAEILKS